MEAFSRKLQLRWSDLDPNYHVRHSVYYDFAAQLRTELFLANDIAIDEMKNAGFGPILFEERAQFRRELRFGDQLHMTAAVKSLRPDFGRFQFEHEIWRAETLCAIVEIKGAWIDIQKRKLTLPPASFIEKLKNFPRAKDFAWEEENK